MVIGQRFEKQGDDMTLLKEDGELLRIFIGETNKYGRMPLYEWIVQQARSQGMAGATVLRGIQGFGANSLIHTTKILRLSEDLPVVVEVVDTPAKIEAFLKTIGHAISEGLVTLEKARVRLYRAGGKANR
jgi:PII-like signaling protein